MDKILEKMVMKITAAGHYMAHESTGSNRNTGRGMAVVIVHGDHVSALKKIFRNTKKYSYRIDNIQRASAPELKYTAVYATEL